MKYLLTLSVSMLLCAMAFGQAKGNYVLIINGDSVVMALDEPVEYEDASGDIQDLRLIQPLLLTYNDNMISFKYNKELSVSNTRIEQGIEQCMIIKPTGNGFMIQKYENLNPTMPTELMLNEITKESVSYGYKRTDKKYERKLASGQTLKGIQATLAYNGEKEMYTVSAYGGKDRGIIVITMLLNEDFKEEDEPMLDLLMNTLTLND